MAVRSVYVTPASEWPASPHSIFFADGAEILCGIPLNLVDVIPADHLGAFDIVTPDPLPPEPDPIDVLIAQVTDLSAQLAALTEDSP